MIQPYELQGDAAQVSTLYCDFDIKKSCPSLLDSILPDTASLPYYLSAALKPALSASAAESKHCTFA